MLHIPFVESIDGESAYGKPREKNLNPLTLTKINNLIPKVDLASLSLLLKTKLNAF